MKTSTPLIAAAVIAMLPLAAFAGDKDKTTAMGAQHSAQFDMLDTNRDGRISQSEASSDSKIMFSSADKNGDGYLDSSEYMHRGKMDQGSKATTPDSDVSQPRN